MCFDQRIIEMCAFAVCTADNGKLRGIMVREIREKESDCGGYMEPVSVWVRNEGEWA